MAYMGRYEIVAGTFVAEVRIWNWNKDLPASKIDNAFGMTGAVDYMVQLVGRREASAIRGSLWLADSEQPKLKVRMEKMAELP